MKTKKVKIYWTGYYRRDRFSITFCDENEYGYYISSSAYKRVCNKVCYAGEDFAIFDSSKLPVDKPVYLCDNDGSILSQLKMM